VVVVVDAETVRERAEDAVTGHLVRSQLRAADLLVLNKIDLVAADRLAATHAWLREFAGRATAIVEATFGQLPVDVALGTRAARGASSHAPAHHEHHEHDGLECEDGDHHHPAFETWSWSGDTPISGSRLVEELKALPDGIVRAKGLLHLTEDPAHRYVLQVVGRRFSIQADRPWGEQVPSSQIVVIGLPGSVEPEQLAATAARLTAQAA
jgi:G3E family GTPase